MKKRKAKKIIILMLSFIFLVSFSSVARAEDNNEKFAYMFDDTEHFTLISWDYSDLHSGINITAYYAKTQTH